MELDQNIKYDELYLLVELTENFRMYLLLS